MQKFIVFLSFILLISACSNSSLLSERDALVSDVQKLRQLRADERLALDRIREETKEFTLCSKGVQPLYIIRFHLKQSHLSLSVKKHIKDAMNAIDFEMSVSKEYYDKVKVGQLVVNNFRVGSAILYGSLGEWEMSIVSKSIK